MSTEQRTITIAAFRDPDGKPTCGDDFSSVSGKCKFIRVSSFGARWHCAVTGDELRDSNRSQHGYLRPCVRCPVWAEKERYSNAGNGQIADPAGTPAA
jgi:hypothetical protein